MTRPTHATAAAPPGLGAEGRDSRDGRDTRWEQHRITRRAELVESTLRAIRHHGAGVGMDEIAAEAGTSKTVLYRHFTDRAGLYVAVVAFVDDLILRDLTVAAAGDTDASEATEPTGAADDPRALMTAVIDSYLRLVERDPEVYRFVVTRHLLDRPVGGDPVAGLTGRIGDHVAAVLAAQLRAHGQDTEAAAAWGHGLVGLVRAVGDHWMTEDTPVPRDQVVRQVTDLVCGGLEAAMGVPSSPAHQRTSTRPTRTRPTQRRS